MNSGVGVCRNAACAKSLTGELIERYPGPGQFCPDCGELLQLPPDPRGAGAPSGAHGGDASPGAQATSDIRAASGGVATAKAAALPEAGAGADGATGEPAGPSPFARIRDAFRSAFADTDGASEAAEPGTRRAPLYALIGIVAAVGIALVVLLPAITVNSKAQTLRICGSSVTSRIASDILAAYAARNAAQAANSSVVTAGPCDVQFSAAPHPGSGTEIARDGVVLIVHPQNPISRISEDQFRRIVSGDITDWSQLGGPRGTIFIVLPAESTDERRAIAQTTLRGTRVASRVLHVASSADIVRLVSGANGRRWLGVVAFSAAVPAKVLPLGNAPIPSAVTIADNRYPLTLDVTVNASDGRSSAAGSLIAFARSREAEAIVSRDGFVAKGN